VRADWRFWLEWFKLKGALISIRKADDIEGILPGVIIVWNYFNLKQNL